MTEAMPNWQNALWAVVNSAGPWWDIVIGIIALVTAVGLFVTLILGHEFDLVVASRSIIGLGLFATFCNIFNSGWLKIGTALIVLGLCLTYLLIATDWCNRSDKSVTLGSAMWRGMGRLFRHVYHQEKVR